MQDYGPMHWRSKVAAEEMSQFRRRRLLVPERVGDHVGDGMGKSKIGWRASPYDVGGAKLAVMVYKSEKGTIMKWSKDHFPKLKLLSAALVWQQRLRLL